MKEFDYKVYRDNLAKKLKSIENHEERKSALNEEKTEGKESGIEGYKYRLAEKKKKFAETQEYQDYIEHVNSLPNALDKMLFVVRDYFNTRRIEKKIDAHDYGMFTASSIYWNKEIFAAIVGELKVSVKTPQELDEFLANLLSDVHSYYNSNPDVFKGDHDALDGHELSKIIGDVIEDAFMTGHPEDDLDWWYTLGKRFSFYSSVRIPAIGIYKKYRKDPRSIEFREYIVSKYGEGASYMFN